MQIKAENHLLWALIYLFRGSCPSSITSLFRIPSSHSSMLWFTCSASYKNLSASFGVWRECWVLMQMAASYFGSKEAFQICHIMSNSGNITRACFQRESGRQISTLSRSVWYKLKQQWSFNPGRQVFEKCFDSTADVAFVLLEG